MTRLQERDRFAAVDEAVIVGQRDVHHRADDDLAFAGHGAVLDRVHAEDAALRRIDDRRREQRAEDAAVGDRERAAFEVLGLEFVLGGAAAEVVDRLLDFGEAQPLGESQHGHDQALRAADGDADVVVVPIDDLVVANFGIERGLIP